MNSTQPGQKRANLEPVWVVMKITSDEITNYLDTGIDGEMDEDVLKFFFGVEDYDRQMDFLLEDKRIAPELVSMNGPNDVYEPYITYSISDFAKRLPVDLDEAKIYRKARKLFLDSLGENGADLMSGFPLERAYLWALVARSMSDKEIRVRIQRKFISFIFQCKSIEKGRILKGNEIDLDDITISEVKKQTMYYVDERGDKKDTHPVCDMFFLSDENVLVLIDVTAKYRNKRGMDMKGKFINDWNQRLKEDSKRRFRFPCPNASIKSVTLLIINPFSIEEKSMVSNESESIFYMNGPVARELLGSLKQFIPWY